MSKAVGWGIVLSLIVIFAIRYGGREDPRPTLHGHSISSYQEQLSRLARQKGGWDETLFYGHTGEGSATIVYADASNTSYTCWLRLMLVVAPHKNPADDRGAWYVPIALIQRDGPQVQQEVPLTTLPKDIRGKFTAKNTNKKTFVSSVTKNRNKYSELAFCSPR